MQIITKYILLRALMEVSKTLKFDRSSKNLSWDVLTERCLEKRKNKKPVVRGL